MIAERYEFRPDEGLIEKILQEGISPILGKIEEQVGESLPSTVTIQNRLNLGPQIFMKRRKDEDEKPRGEIRLRCRRKLDSNTIYYYAESIFRDVSPSTGFSGFTAKGEVIDNNGDLTLTSKTWCIRYSVWDWMGW